jgi:hypothetical protein
MHRAVPIVLILLSTQSAPARADTLYLKANGKAVVKGVRLVDEDASKYYFLDLSLKRRAYAKSMIGRVSKERTVIHEYQERAEALKSGDAAVELAKWASKKRFHKDVVRATYERAVVLDGSQEEAHAFLGNVQYKGEWMSPAERDRRIEDVEAAEMKAQGLVKYKGEWVTAADKENLDKGLVKFEGKWMTSDQLQEAKGFVKFGGKWVKKDELEIQKLLGPARRATGLGERLAVHMTDHYAILGDLPPEKMKILGKTMEKLHAEWLKLFPSARENRQLLGGPEQLHVQLPTNWEAKPVLVHGDLRRDTTHRTNG